MKARDAMKSIGEKFHFLFIFTAQIDLFKPFQNQKMLGVSSGEDGLRENVKVGFYLF